MRGQATSIDMSSEVDPRNTKIPKSLRTWSFDDPKTTNNKHALSNKLPTYLQSLHCVGSARPSTALTGLGSDISNSLSTIFNTWKLPDISSLHNVIRTGIRLEWADANFYFSIRQGKQSANYNTTGGFKNRRYGGAYRDRTDDPLLAKQVLSQLS
jgi:hypothetical protein